MSVAGGKFGWPWAVRDRSLAMGPARHVLLVLATYADKSGGNVYPSTQTIADGAGLARSTVQAALRELELANEIERVGRRGVGRHGTIEYRLTLPDADRPPRRRLDEHRTGRRSGRGGDTGPGGGPEGGDPPDQGSDREPVRAEEREG